MRAAGTQSLEVAFCLNEEERVELVLFLEQALRDTLVEEHRTEAPDYRERIQRREAVLNRFLDKLRQS